MVATYNICLYIPMCQCHTADVNAASVDQMAPPQQLRQQTSSCSLLLIHRPQKDERLSWPGYSGWHRESHLVTQSLATVTLMIKSGNWKLC